MDGANEAMVAKSVAAVTAESLRDWPIERLRSFFAESMTRAAADIYNGALAWSEMKRRGEEIPPFNSKLAKYLPAIASGELAAELVLNYPYDSVLRPIVGVPIEEQKRLANDGKFQVVASDGKIVETNLANLNIGNQHLVSRAYKHGRAVPPDEQKLLLPEPAKPKSKAKPPAVQIVRAEEGQGPYRPIEESALKDGKVSTEVVRFYPGELENLQGNAAAAGVSVSELVRRIVHENGLLKKRGK